MLLVRRTYGGAAGQLLIPGGYCNIGELPEETAQREVLEEALEREDVTHMTKVALRAMLSENKKLLYSDEEYKEVRGNDYSLYM